MTTYRTHKTDKYSVLSNGPVNNTELSFKAKGILWYLLTKPDGWKPKNYDIANAGPDKKGAVSSGVNELLRAGYMFREKHQDKKGQWHWTVHTYEEPLPEDKRVKFDKDNKPIYSPETQKPNFGLSDSGKPAYRVSTNSVSTNSNKDNNNGNSKTLSEKLPLKEQSSLIGKTVKILSPANFAGETTTITHYNYVDGSWDTFTMDLKGDTRIGLLLFRSDFEIIDPPTVNPHVIEFEAEVTQVLISEHHHVAGGKIGTIKSVDFSRDPDKPLYWIYVKGGAGTFQLWDEEFEIITPIPRDYLGKEVLITSGPKKGQTGILALSEKEVDWYEVGIRNDKSVLIYSYHKIGTFKIIDPPETPYPTAAETLAVERPDEAEYQIDKNFAEICTLWQNNISISMGPILSDSIQEIMDGIPKPQQVQWFEAAIKKAVEVNARKPAYIFKILENWMQAGRMTDKKQGPNPSTNGQVSQYKTAAEIKALDDAAIANAPAPTPEDLKEIEQLKASLKAGYRQ